MGARSPHVFNQCRASREAVAESVKAIAEEYSRGDLLEAGQEPQRRHPPSGIAPSSQTWICIGGKEIAMCAFANRLGGENTFLRKDSSLPPSPLLFPKTFIPTIARGAGCGIIEANKARRAWLYRAKQSNDALPSAHLFGSIGRVGRSGFAASPDGGSRRCGSPPASKRLPREYSSTIALTDSAAAFPLARL